MEGNARPGDEGQHCLFLPGLSSSRRWVSSFLWARDCSGWGLGPGLWDSLCHVWGRCSVVANRSIWCLLQDQLAGR